MTSVTVAIQGEAGSFSHAAALQALGRDIRLVPCPSFDELFRAVEAGDAARGAVPIENSLAGSVHENHDLMAGRVAADAAIASSLAAELYGAVVLEQDLEDHAENYTRFLMVARDPAPPELARKTSLVFTLPNAPGSLHRALGVFAARGLDLTKIESRPLAGRPWEYAFYLDVVGDPRAGVAEALAELRGLARELRILGAYPGSDIPVAKG